jgi:hypothetical protein
VAPSDRSPAGSILQALGESVDCWPMVITVHKRLGDLPKSVTVSWGVTGDRESPLEGCMSQAAGGPRGPGVVSEADRPLGNSVGAIG